MDENLALMLYGCKLAKDLEQNLQMLANQPDILLNSCEEIVRVFSSIKERLISQRQMNEWQQLDDQIGAGIQEWLRTGGVATTATTATTTTVTREPMDLLNAQQQQLSGLELVVSGGRDMSRGSRGGSVGEIKQLTNAPDFSRTSSSQKQRRRSKDEGQKIVKRVPAPQMGNLDLPPEDGYTWRKYGQKEILGSTYPR
ncbi:hypothetical protein DH2020_010242 [Rehmannia glutinosa]|uniref:WRKY domain-containing protein n=1 Tax=Rehmannia glutinosa TaxID=99300 RepID=A0ABR0X910_REHGL